MIGSALADPSRARILCALMDGRAFTNKELACVARISPQTASSHLKHLEALGMTSSLRSGRCVYHRIAREEVAEALESLAVLAPTDHLERAKLHRSKPDSDCLLARSCYNHIAGRLGVLMTERLLALRVLVQAAEQVMIGPDGASFFRRLGFEAQSNRNQNKPAVKFCLDWTERKHHISGGLATKILDLSLERNWLTRHPSSRALKVTDLGYRVYAEEFGLCRASLEHNA